MLFFKVLLECTICFQECRNRYVLALTIHSFKHEPFFVGAGGGGRCLGHVLYGRVWKRDWWGEGIRGD